MRIILYLAVAILVVAGPAAAGAPPAATIKTPPKASKPSPPGSQKCGTGQVKKWNGHGWVCADDLTGGGGSGGGSGPQMVDATGADMGPVLGTTTPPGGVTVPTMLFLLSDSPKPFLLAVDEGGFQSNGRLLVHTTTEAVTCVMSCGADTACLTSCISGTAACAASNAALEPLTPVSPLFRDGAVVGGTLWVATSSTLAPVGECVDFGFPACVTATYNPADDTCGIEITPGGPEFQRQGYPAIPLVNLHTVHPPPYTLRPR